MYSLWVCRTRFSGTGKGSVVDAEKAPTVRGSGTAASPVQRTVSAVRGAVNTGKQATVPKKTPQSGLDFLLETTVLGSLHQGLIPKFSIKDWGPYGLPTVAES